MISIEKAIHIGGWMDVPELVWLAQRASEHKVIVEIGSFIGRSTRALGDNTEGTVYALDDFRGPDDALMPRWSRTQVYDFFGYNLADLIEMGRVVPVVCDYNDINLDARPDMVFIDGDHAYESVKRDLDRWKDTEFLCGHDSDRPDVKRALDELPNKITYVENTSLWFR